MTDQNVTNNWRRHALHADHKKKMNLYCDYCLTEFRTENRILQHFCVQNHEPKIKFDTFNVKESNDDFTTNLIGKLSPLALHELCFEVTSFLYQRGHNQCLSQFQKSLSIPGIYPPLFVDFKWRKMDWSRYGNPEGKKFVVSVLKEKISKGKDNIVVLRKAIDLRRKGKHFMRLPTTVLIPKSKLFEVIVNEDGETVSVSLKVADLKEPPIDNQKSAKLMEYSKYDCGNDSSYTHIQHM